MITCDIFNFKYFYVDNNENVNVFSVVSCTFVDIWVFFQNKMQVKISEINRKYSVNVH